MKRRTTRLARILFNTLTAMSLILALATAGLWVRSLFFDDYIYFNFEVAPSKVAYSVDISSGYSGVCFIWSRPQNAYPAAGVLLPHFDHWESLSAKENLGTRLSPGGSGFTLTRFTGYVFVGFPYWFPLLLSLALPLSRIVHAAVRRTHRPGHCRVCGYDIRANPAKCSECGFEIAAASD